MYAVKDRDLYVNLFAGNTATIKIGGKDVILEQITNYPWDGDIALTIKKNQAKAFNLKIRVPGWVEQNPVPSNLYSFSDDVLGSYNIKVNGQVVKTEMANGFFVINRLWKKGDVVSIHFDMPVRTVKANPAVVDDRGRIAVERGPLVYCAEGIDNQDFNIFNFLMPRQPRFEVTDLQINGNRQVTFNVKAIQVEGQFVNTDEKGEISATHRRLTMIPYYAWNHRGPGLMEVWMPQSISALGNY